MPIDFDMLLSAINSSPAFPYSPFVDANFSFPRSCTNNCRNNVRLMRNSFLQPHSKHESVANENIVFESYDSKESNNNTVSKKSDGSRKKKVSFADDKGLNLVEIREIPGERKLSVDALTLLVGGLECQGEKEKNWKKAFEKPPWTDEELMCYLDNQAVILESVSLNESDGTLSGKIKVKNISYEKDVFIRITFDRWMSYDDITAFYEKSEKTNSETIYDMFSFNTKIISTAEKYDVIEFCVGFRCNSQEYWDNNGGVNYRIVAEPSKTCTVPTCYPKETKPYKKMTFSITENMEKFSEINSWSNFMQQRPYW
ncbi:hypothetical protein X975_08344, partial [Stegodyphus mimosarum]